MVYELYFSIMDTVIPFNSILETDNMPSFKVISFFYCIKTYIVIAIAIIY